MIENVLLIINWLRSSLNFNIPSTDSPEHWLWDFSYQLCFVNFLEYAEVSLSPCFFFFFTLTWTIFRVKKIGVAHPIRSSPLYYRRNEYETSHVFTTVSVQGAVFCITTHQHSSVSWYRKHVPLKWWCPP